MKLDEMRAAFEAWAIARGVALHRETMSGTEFYSDEETRVAFCAWQAGALAALDEAFIQCANDPDHRLEVIRRLRDTIAKGESE